MLVISTAVLIKNNLGSHWRFTDWHDAELTAESAADLIASAVISNVKLLAPETDADGNVDMDISLSALRELSNGKLTTPINTDNLVTMKSTTTSTKLEIGLRKYYTGGALDGVLAVVRYRPSDKVKDYLTVFFFPADPENVTGICVPDQIDYNDDLGALLGSLSIELLSRATNPTLKDAYKKCQAKDGVLLLPSVNNVGGDGEYKLVGRDVPKDNLMLFGVTLSRQGDVYRPKLVTEVRYRNDGKFIPSAMTVGEYASINTGTSKWQVKVNDPSSFEPMIVANTLDMNSENTQFGDRLGPRGKLYKDTSSNFSSPAEDNTLKTIIDAIGIDSNNLIKDFSENKRIYVRDKTNFFENLEKPDQKDVQNSIHATVATYPSNIKTSVNGLYTSIKSELESSDVNAYSPEITLPHGIYVFVSPDLILYFPPEYSYENLVTGSDSSTTPFTAKVAEKVIATLKNGDDSDDIDTAQKLADLINTELYSSYGFTAVTITDLSTASNLQKNKVGVIGPSSDATGKVEFKTETGSSAVIFENYKVEVKGRVAFGDSESSPPYTIFTSAEIPDIKFENGSGSGSENGSGSGSYSITSRSFRRVDVELKKPTENYDRTVLLINGGSAINGLLTGQGIIVTRKLLGGTDIQVISEETASNGVVVTQYYMDNGENKSLIFETAPIFDGSIVAQAAEIFNPSQKDITIFSEGVVDFRRAAETSEDTSEDTGSLNITTRDKLLWALMQTVLQKECKDNVDEKLIDNINNFSNLDKKAQEDTLRNLIGALKDVDNIVKVSINNEGNNNEETIIEIVGLAYIKFAKNDDKADVYVWDVDKDAEEKIGTVKNYDGLKSYIEDISRKLGSSSTSSSSTMLGDATEDIEDTLPEDVIMRPKVGGAQNITTALASTAYIIHNLFKPDGNELVKEWKNKTPKGAPKGDDYKILVGTLESMHTTWEAILRDSLNKKDGETYFWIPNNKYYNTGKDVALFVGGKDNICEPSDNCKVNGVSDKTFIVNWLPEAYGSLASDAGLDMAYITGLVIGDTFIIKTNNEGVVFRGAFVAKRGLIADMNADLTFIYDPEVFNSELLEQLSIKLSKHFYNMQSITEYRRDLENDKSTSTTTTFSEEGSK